MNLIKADLQHREMFRRYVKKCIDDGLDLYASAKNNPDAYLSKRIAYSVGNSLPAGWPPISTYFYIQSDEIIGSIRVRHGNNEYIENVVGHIGYETLPEARGKGIASTMLTWVMQNIINDRIIVTCVSDNIASKAVIERCGGEYLNTLYSEEEFLYIARYQLGSRRR